MLLSTLSLQDRKTQPSSSGEAMSREACRRLREESTGFYRAVTRALMICEGSLPPT